MDKKLITYSVIIPIYNQEEYLNTTISSLLCNIRPCDEAILIDDCSTDSSYKILLELAGGLPNFRILKNDVNMGHVETLNRAANLAKNDYLIVIGGDDVLSKDYIAQLNLNIVPSADVCFPPVMFFRFDEEINSPDLSTRNSILNLKQLALSWGSFHGEKYSIIGCVIKRDSFLAVGGFSKEFIVEDHELFLRMAKNGYSLMLIGGSGAYYRFNPNSISKKSILMLQQDIKIIARHITFPFALLCMFRRVISITIVNTKRKFGLN